MVVNRRVRLSSLITVIHGIPARNRSAVMQFVWASLVLAFAGVACGGPIARSPKLPATLPWQLDQLSEAPAFQWVDKTGPIRSLFYEGEKFRNQPTRVFAYYATPGTLAGNAQQDTDLPAVVLIHGGGGTAFREWVELWARRGYAAIAMDLAGCRPDKDMDGHARDNRIRLSDGGPDQGDDEKFGSVAQPVNEQWPYHAVAAVLRAHSLMLSFPEVNVGRTAVTGISWGGYLTCIVAAVDNRFHAAVPVYGCGFLHENSAWIDRLAKMTLENRQRWITLWDPSQYLPAVSMPILFVNGTNDFAYPLDSYMKSFDAVSSTKQLRITVNMPHSHPAGWEPREIGLFIDQHLRHGEPLPGLDEPKIDGEKVRVKCNSRLRLTGAALHRTTDDGPVNKRQWQSISATIEGDSVSSDTPSADTRAWFLTVTDERGAVVSTRVVFCKNK